jgi:hypothetical protein
MITQITLKNKYYCLVSGLVELTFGQEKLPISQHDYLSLLKRDLYPSDYELVRYFFILYDQENLLNTLKENEKPFDERGVFNKEQIELLANTKEIEPVDVLPGQFYDYLKNLAIHYNNDIPFNPDVSWENQFISEFYEFACKSDNQFVREWFMFEMNLKNVITGIISNTYDLNAEKELIGNNEVTEAIKSVRAKDFGLAREYDFIDKLLNLFENATITEREKGIDQIKWETLNQMTTFFYFSIENVLAYLMKVRILERWTLLDEEKGRETFEQIIKELKNSYEFPEYFVV